MAEKKNGGFRTSIGGQALIEGILMRGPDRQAIVVRDKDGQLVEKVEELKLIKDPYKKTKFYGNIFKPSYLIQQEGQYKGYPLRTFVGNNFQGGFSDHLPVFIYIAK